MRVLDFLIENSIFDYSRKDICKETGVSWNTMKGFWGVLEKKQVVVFTRKVGRAKMFKLNEKNPIVKKLLSLDMMLGEV